MTRRFAITLLVLALTAAAGAPVLAHPGHEHKVLGTVTMAAADHVMLKATDNKDVTVYITKDTKVRKNKQPMKVADIKTGMRVVVTAVTEKQKNQEKTMAKIIELGAAAPTK